ncbi:Gfo/Idh/MocA family oxidoreductase [Solirubrobacter ginsenosidimutans]|uniref:Gfo/Idh/MocA family oxidoreductase n=1 Tax=Solirubrobacter ginsenosidimutans TaxID=490573 RepID=A0A9X3MZ25_9ACTN|nr:Gfo/Idh/MocA family oxidoreductase [Solirubrobacter ginsenosidimutans]MDA0165489.1 Gfo/Idh/MocA family oxidoreductase [Solirubrobacter ginsenosidimutans]
MIRWGILSTARIAQRIVEGARLSESAKIVAVGSRDLTRAQAYADEHGIERVHGSYEDLLADPEVDAVYIPLPNSMHVPWTVTALEAGKHVLCEKPLSRDPAQVELAFDAAERAGRVLMEAFMWRFHPQTDELVRLVRSGAVGDVRLVRTAFGFGGIDPDNVRLQSSLEGGALMDVGCYCVSALRLLCGEPERVSGEQVLGGDGVDIRFAGTLRFAGDVVATFDCGMDVHRRHSIEVVGSDGTILVPSPWQTPSGTEILVTREDTERIVPETVDPYARELDEVAAAIAEGRSARLGRDESLGQARVIAALYRSAADGVSVVP